MNTPAFIAKEIERKNMITAVAESKDSPMAVLNQVIMKGDLSKLNDAEKMYYYNEVCKSLNLNPLTRPFDYLTLNGKLTLYARKDCTEQLRRINNISIKITSKEVMDDAFVVSVEASTPDGRVDSDMGAVSIKGLSGDAKINAMLKSITKAKRRVTLSISGLGLPDESELETIQRDTGATTGSITAKEAFGSVKLMKAKWSEIAAEINACNSNAELDKMFAKNKIDFANFKAIDEQLFENLCQLGQNRRDAIMEQEGERELDKQMDNQIGAA